MKELIISLFVLLPTLSGAQGTFFPNNFNAPTRIGSANGSFAGPGVWAQFLVGTNTDSLTPVGMALEHRPTGYVSGEIVTVPGIDGGMRAFIQMWAWDGSRWGTDISGVPPGQFGRTDIVPITLTFSSQPAFPPLFTMPAVVPIPEPSTYALGAVGLAALWLASRTRRRKQP